MEWENAPDIEREIEEIADLLLFSHLNLKRVICFRSYGSTSRAQARIWSFPRVWQLALKQPAAYIVEVLSEKFDKLSQEEQKKVLIHELLHIPKNFSGSLLPHRGRGRGINRHTVEKLFKDYNLQSKLHKSR